MGTLVSTIIPTYNRLEDVVIAVRTARAQTYKDQEIIIVDDGSTDGTAEKLREEHGDALRFVRTNRAGVSGARNRGIAEAKGELIALLDSDDEWEPEKLAKQVAFFERNPDYGIVITDVVRMDRNRKETDRFRRRDVIKQDGDVLRDLLKNPALAPSSALVRKRVFEEVGDFDGSLPTAEDIDFFLRAALRFKVGVLEEPLTRAMRGHEGLSALARTYDDYLYVMERYLLDHKHDIPAEDRRVALREAYLRNMRGLLVSGRLLDGTKVGARLATKGKSAADVLPALGLMPLGLRIAATKSLRERGRRLWMKYALRKVKQNDAHDRLDLAYQIEDPWHMNTDRERYRFQQTNRIIEENIGKELSSILEVGSGEGHQTEYLARLTKQMTGIEVSARAVDRAKERLPNATFIAGDLLAQPWASERGKFGLVTACEVLYYMSDVPKFLRTMDELGEQCLVTYFAPAARICKEPLSKMPGLKETSFSHGEETWIAAWWPGAKSR